jgi:hypothetical protein
MAVATVAPSAWHEARACDVSDTLDTKLTLIGLAVPAPLATPEANPVVTVPTIASDNKALDIPRTDTIVSIERFQKQGISR